MSPDAIRVVLTNREQHLHELIGELTRPKLCTAITVPGRSGGIARKVVALLSHAESRL
jgi:hypothetical protein